MMKTINPDNFQFNMQAPAKINYVLEVLERREDGYHEINTVYQTISFYDHLYFQETNRDIEVLTDSDELQDPLANLVFKSASLVARMKNVNKGAKIFLRKNIPIGAGLGGGSSDAACTLKGLNRLWKLNLTELELQNYAAQIGADVPFFLRGGLAIGKGKGDKITYISRGMRPKFPIILVCPTFKVSTADAYMEWDEGGYFSRGSGLDSFMKSLYGRNLMGMAGNLFNDFEALIIKKHSPIQAIKNRLMRSGALGALMTGSGSAVFGIFENMNLSDDVLNNLMKLGRVVRATTI
ncbi:MAG: 4-(cytidine 5'-diphospho)-2-C-methyl-D-erythritol kinase [Candidatus Eremiobacteraeota bacterium]|nr:4-(cytidine 5'-diphospho)-2-C-methyl-D-erythritol kinase [Candidatus Eremiobacteraeota bacterium]